MFQQILCNISGRHFLVILIMANTFCMHNTTASSVVSITSGNVDDVFGSNELIFVNFYANWCRFSQMLTPIFEDTSKKVAEEFPEHGRVVLGKIDCDAEDNIAAKYQVSKYPTLKLFRYGQPVKKEYRGQRSAVAMLEFIRKQLEDPINPLFNLEELNKLDKKQRKVVGYFDSADSDEYKALFRKVASYLRDDCVFYAAIGPVFENERASGNKIVFRPPGEGQAERTYPDSMSNYDTMLQWTWEMCVPIVREITFENAEELTEEGLPFMILFHHPDDIDTPERYRKQISVELTHDKYAVNFLTADGEKFNHPLQHLGKTSKDLPLLAIDSFRHMYVWRHDVRTDIDKPGLLTQFLQDLQSGKLHREFHHGPDPTPPPQKEDQKELPVAGDSVGHIPKDAEEEESADLTSNTPTRGSSTSPPESLFRKLGPSKNRYTLLRDEL